MTEKLPPEEAWDRAVESMLDDEAARISKMAPAELDHSLESKGVDPKEIRAKGEALAARLAAMKRPEATSESDERSADTAPRATALRSRHPKKRTSAVYTWGLAAAALAAALAFLLTREQETPGPIVRPAVTPSDSSARPGPTPEVLAATLRRDALTACHAKQWYDCREKLDEAARLDPAGETDPDVVRARAVAQNGILEDVRKNNAKGP